MSDAPAPNPDLVQISKADLATLQKSFTLLNKLWDDPEHGGDLKRAAKKVDPSLRIPEIDVAEPLLKPINETLTKVQEENAKLREEMEKDRQSREDDKELGKLVENLAKAQKRYNLTDLGMAEVRKRMAEDGIASPMAAAALVASDIEPAKPMSGSNFAPADLNPLGIDGKSDEADIKALHTNPEKWFDRAVPEILAEFEQDAA